MLPSNQRQGAILDTAGPPADGANIGPVTVAVDRPPGCNAWLANPVKTVSVPLQRRAEPPVHGHNVPVRNRWTRPDGVLTEARLRLQLSAPPRESNGGTVT